MRMHSDRKGALRILVPVVSLACAGAAFSAPALPPRSVSAPLPVAAAPADSGSASSDTAAKPPPPGLDYVAVERASLAEQPILREKRLEIDKAEQKRHELDMAAILPKFSVETGMGPAPGLRTLLDSTSSFLPDSTPVIQHQKDYDFHEWGPFFGIEATVAQPLNFTRFVAGRRAAAANVKVAEAQFQKERLDVSEEAQQRYFQRVYAGQMQSILEAAGKDLDKAQRKMEELLDEGDAGIKQTDLLELKAGRYALDKARNEAGLGAARAELALRFLLHAPDTSSLALKDTILTLRTESLPSLDSLKMLALLNHPDLKRLANGLAARRELLRVAKGELGPDIFLFGSFRYTKAWSPARSSGGEDPFARDPLNEITGLGGLGVRLNLNFWSRYEKVRKEKIELRQLERTEAYAARGLLLRLQDEYLQMLNYRADAAAAQKSLRAAEAWLKGAAMKYDLDPSAAKDMISPYKTVLGAKRDYYEAVLNYNLAVAKVIKAVGWTLGEFLNNLGPKD
jgi:outer membrane protein TolC